MGMVRFEVLDDWCVYVRRSRQFVPVIAFGRPKRLFAPLEPR